MISRFIVTKICNFMTVIPRKMLVTCALPYANGQIHLGHLVEHIQTDIWVRFQKMQGHDCIAVCGDDAHGTPIMIKAEELGISPEDLIKQTYYAHLEDLSKFHIDYDYYGTTHSEENFELSKLIYQRLKARGDINSKVIEQAFDPEKQMFLPDRFIKGECPSCKAPDQYGDSCDNCGATYLPTDLKNPRSVISGAIPIQKQSEHFFFNLPNYEAILKTWIKSPALQTEVSHKLSEWFNLGLEEWDISRDAPYFGFEIPDAPGKYFYVWLDAPIGYMSSFKQLCQKNPNLNFDEYWGIDSTIELHHFIGKDIVYFHALFWPAMLTGAEFRIPTKIHVHGFLTVDNKKMSKSRGTFIQAKTYLEHFDPEYLRYYFAAKLTNTIDDLDFNFEDFLNRVNADLVNKVINIGSRCAGFINKRFNNMLSSACIDPNLYEIFVERGENIAKYYEEGNYHHAVREIMALADKANQYIDEKKPWLLIKEKNKEQDVKDICSMGLNLFRLLIIYLKPILPIIASRVEDFFNISTMNWQSGHKPLLKHEIKTFSPLMQRITQENIETFKEAAKAALTIPLAKNH